MCGGEGAGGIWREQGQVKKPVFYFKYNGKPQEGYKERINMI